ncbi:phage baseplate protein [Pasteurella bettyae]|uniref:P68 RBP/TagC-like beta-propeller domain-containing protein n=1 Tax=Pasteurella bettyae CCUG 2042 TaxID=1095749 RepID=I3DEK0_9PAST|nr:hypothetical protein [Pasteurella bettyae]EIJ70143.1 hypothetical protein HMPREF1052_1542 [Pasteurella bettyae CCUG 2042]SUB21938.1 Uncharacterised protein [Pasteurella bettyae]
MTDLFFNRRNFLTASSLLLLSSGLSFSPLALALKQKFNPASDFSFISNAELINSLVRIGPSANNVVQGFAIDSLNKTMFSQHVGGKPEKSYVCRYHLLDGNIQAESYMSLENIGGHQGIGVQYIEKTMKLWASAGAAITDYGACAIRFPYQPNKSIDEYEVFKLFDTENFKPTGTVTPCISSDNKYLIVVGHLKQNHNSVIRVFDLSIFNQGGNYTEQYVYQWEITALSKEKSFPVQGVASDGNMVVIQLGFTDPNINKATFVYQLDGQLLYYTQDNQVGRKEALTTGQGKHWEPEGMCFAQDRKGQLHLYQCIVCGDAGKRIVNIYGSVVPI